MTSSKIFLYFCLAFVAGIFLNSLIKIPQLAMLGVLILGVILISVFWKHKKSAVLGFCILFLVLGIWRHQSAELKIADSGLQDYSDNDQAVTLIGIVTDQPSVKSNSIKLTIESEKLETGGKIFYISGKILVMTGRYPEYEYGDELEITGELVSPSEDIEGFNYKDYLAKDGIYSTMSWPKIEKIAGGKGNFILGGLFGFKNRLEESVNKVMSPPQSGLLEALFFGDEENISQEWKDKFNLTGTRHITAVSGMNITIISALIINFLLMLGLWRRQAFYISVILIIFYVLMIGAPASAVRAGVMGLIFLCAQNFGRMSSASYAIAFASTFMLAQNPLLLRFDVGFQLSFLAVTGLVYLQPVFSELFKKVPDFLQMRYTLSATMAAQVFTLPILVFNFGRIALISPLANILIVPFLSFITILGFIFSFAGLVFYPLGLVLSWPAWLLLSYVLGVISFFAKIPFATIQVGSSGRVIFTLFYLIFIFFVWRLKKRFAAPRF
jgi:competence protein ComEC